MSLTPSDVNVTTFDAAMCTGGVHQDAPHDPRRHGEKVPPVLPVDLVNVEQSEIRLIDERRRLQCMVRTLLRHVAPRQAPQLLVDQRHQLVQGGCVASPPCEQ